MQQVCEKQLISLLQIYRTEHIGAKTFYTLHKLYHGDMNAILEAIPSLSIRGGRKQPIKVFSKDLAEKELEATKRYGAKILSFLDPLYPTSLKSLSDAPALMTVQGELSLLKKPTFAIVGTRNASLAGCKLTKLIAQDLGKHGFVIASGLARGIDTIAHQSSLNTGTIACIAGGINTHYPPENEQLQRMIAQNGVVITELPFNVPPKGRHFPQRNRIISGLSQGVLVVEATRKSGTLITANFALEQGRDVFAVPGSPFDPRCQGPNHLLREGAILCESAHDIIQYLSLNHTQQSTTLYDQHTNFESSKQQTPDDATLERARTLVLPLLGQTPVSVDDILHHTSLSSHILAIILVELELAGKLLRYPANHVALMPSMTEA